jgi:hypothetical protein
MTFTCALAQAPQTEVASPTVPRTQPVPLVSGTCPAVRQGGVISLDWNPGFDPSSAVTGMKSLRLIFHHFRKDGVTSTPRPGLCWTGALVEG